MITELNTEKFDELLKGEKPVVCDFSLLGAVPARCLRP